MSTSDINSGRGKYAIQLRRTIWAYLIVSAAAIAVDKIYGIYSHGVDSEVMTWMFLYPLVGGAMFCSILGHFVPRITKSAGCRLFLNLHSSGIAALTLSALLQGVFEIAGTGSPHLFYYNVVGWAFILAGLVVVITKEVRSWLS